MPLSAPKGKNLSSRKGTAGGEELGQNMLHDFTSSINWGVNQGYSSGSFG